jgi:mannonate dehydratase
MIFEPSRPTIQRFRVRPFRHHTTPFKQADLIMNRRDLLKNFACAAGGATLASGGQPCGVTRSCAADPAADAQRGAPPLKITDIKTILTAPARIRLVVVKVLTSEPGLYGLGCATFTQRARVVETALDKYLRPFLIGKNPLDIEDVWQSSFVSSYWRNGPVLNNAISGVDMALWDILGKRAGMPVYQLFGGKCRKAVDTYRHASGRTFAEVADRVAASISQGYRHVRVQVTVPGLSTYGAGAQPGAGDEVRGSQVWEPRPYVRAVPKLFEHLRSKFDDKVELLHDTHERVPPILGIQLAKDLEAYRPFFLEDPFSPEDIGYFKHLRQQTSTPIAMGELFNSPHEWTGLVSERLIDFIRVHISQMGGLTMARKMAAMCEFFAVRTAWHGPGDVSPVGHAANVHLDLATPNFGIQEAREFSQAERDVFPGCPELKDGYYWANDRPGLGIDLDEKLAAKFPIRDDPPFDFRWGELRRLDGSITKP